MISDYIDLQQRLAKLEKQNCTFRRAAMALLAVFGALLLMGQAAPEPHGIREKLISTEKLVLTDAAGKMRAMLYAAEDGPKLDFYDAQGNRGMSFILNQDGPRIYLTGNSGQPNAVLGPEQIALQDVSTRRIVAMSLNPSGAGVFVNDGPRAHATLMLVPLAGPVLELHDKSGTRSAVLSSAEDGPQLELDDEQGYQAVLGSKGLATSYSTSKKR
jgi:hypothetical protein